MVFLNSYHLSQYRYLTDNLKINYLNTTTITTNWRTNPSQTRTNLFLTI